MSPSPTALPPITTVPPEELQRGGLAREGTWAIAFLADWCPFCRRFTPEFASLAGQGFEIARADLTEYDSPLWDALDIEVVPTVIVYRDGRPIFRANGRLGAGLGADALGAVLAAASSV